MIGIEFSELAARLGFDEKSKLNDKKAQLFPNGTRHVEDEQTTSSIFLATLLGIKEFRESLLTSLNNSEASKISNQTAQLYAYTEVAPRGCFDDKEERPDALLILTTGKQNKIISWAAWIEVKVGNNVLDEKQLKKYLSLNKLSGVSTVISISNEFVSQVNISPTGIVNKNLFHWSWKFILSKLRQVKHLGIKDEDQQYLASQLILYLEKHKGITSFNYMGKNWKNDAEHIAKSEKSQDNAIQNVAAAWAQEEKDIALKLTDTKLEKYTYQQVDLALTKGELTNDKERVDNLKKQLLNKRILSTVYNVPNLNNKYLSPRMRKFDLTVHVNTTRAVLQIEIPATSIKGAKSIGQMSNFLQILSNTGEEDEIRIQVDFGRRKQSETESLKKLQEQKDSPYSTYVILNDYQKETIKNFKISYEHDFTKRDFFSPSKFIERIEEATSMFYSQVVAAFF